MECQRYSVNPNAQKRTRAGSANSKMSDQQQILCRFNKLPVRNQATILFVGTKGVGKHRLAKAMLEVNVNFSLQIRTATALPLPSETDSQRPRIDFVVFFIDLTNSLSLQVIKSSLCHLDLDYFFGRCCFVSSQVGKEAFQSITLEEVATLSDAYDSPLLFTNLEVERDQRCLAKKLLRQLETSCGFQSDVTPLLMDTTRQCFTFEDDM